MKSSAAQVTYLVFDLRHLLVHVLDVRADAVSVRKVLELRKVFRNIIFRSSYGVVDIRL